MLPSFYCLLFYEASVVTLCNLRHVSNDEIKVTLVMNVLTKRLQFCTEIKNHKKKFCLQKCENRIHVQQSYTEIH